MISDFRLQKFFISCSGIYFEYRSCHTDQAGCGGIDKLLKINYTVPLILSKPNLS